MGRVVKSLLAVFTIVVFSACESGPGGGNVEVRESYDTCGISAVQYDVVLEPEAYQTLELGSPVVLQPNGHCDGDFTYHWGVGDTMDDARAEAIESHQYMTEVTEPIRVWMLVFEGRTHQTELSTYVDLNATTPDSTTNTFIILDPQRPFADQAVLLSHVVMDYSGETTLLSDYFDDLTGVDWDVVEMDSPENVAFSDEFGPAAVTLPAGTLTAGVLYMITATGYRESGSVYAAPFAQVRPEPW